MPRPDTESRILHPREEHVQRQFSKKGGRSPTRVTSLDGDAPYAHHGTLSSYVSAIANCDAHSTDRLVAPRTTMPARRTSSTKDLGQSESIEVVVSEPRLLSMGSQFGHVALIVDGKTYSRATERYFTTDKSDYLRRNAYRNSVGYVIRVSQTEKVAIKTELERRVHLHAIDPESHEYSLLDNNCSSNVADVLQKAGIVAHDPRWLAMGIISPADIVTGLNHSQRVARKIHYPKTR